MMQVKRSHFRMLLAVLQLALLSAGAAGSVKMPYVITESGLKLYSVSGSNATRSTFALPRVDGAWWPRPWSQRIMPVHIDYTKYSTGVQKRIKEDISRFNNQACVRVKEVNCSTYLQGPCIKISSAGPKDSTTFKEVTEPGMPASAGTFYYIVQDVDLKMNGFLRHAAALVGLPSEHNRHDRDEFLILNTTNSSDLTVFAKDEKTFLGESQYDFRSATHMPYDVARNMSNVSMALGKPEWESLRGDSVPLTIARNLSAKDISRINRIHNCTISTSATPQGNAGEPGMQDTTPQSGQDSVGKTRDQGNGSVPVVTDSTSTGDGIVIETGKKSGSAGIKPSQFYVFVVFWTLWCLRSPPNCHQRL